MGDGHFLCHVMSDLQNDETDKQFPLRAHKSGHHFGLVVLREVCYLEAPPFDELKENERIKKV